MSLLPEKGERSLSVGQTGSGKTAFNVWMLARIPSSPVIIYDTKIEPKFLNLPTAIVTNSWNETVERVNSGEHDYIVFRPPVQFIAEPRLLDNFLFAHITQLPGVDAYIDEAYSFHNAGRAGKGLSAMITQGRSRGISTFMSTQRPVMLSRFALTESQHLYVFVIAHEDDRKTLNKLIPGFAEKPMISPNTFKFWHYNGISHKLTLFHPVKLDGTMKTDYTDLSVVEPDADKVRRLTWI